MAVRAFTKVLVKQGQSLLDGLLGKSHLPRIKLPKQKAVNVADIAAKTSKCPTQPVARESWLRQYAWKTLASDLRKRAAWQFSGRAGGRLAEGQRWLLFPAYGFLGLGLASKPVSADEVDTGFDTVTNQIKGMFEKNAGRDTDTDSPCGRLIARGSRVALYKLDTPTPEVDEKIQESCEEIAEESEIYEEAEESLPEEDSNDKVSFECKKPLPCDVPTCVNLNFTTEDGRSFSVAINVAPGETHPVALDSVSIDGKVTKYCNPSVKIEKMIGEAMHESTHQENSHEQKQMSDYLAPYESLNSQSIEVINEGHSIVSDVLSEEGVPALDPCMPILSYDHNPELGISNDVSPSLSSTASDITIIDDTMELDLEFPDLEEPIFLDDLADDPLRDLTFVNHYEAINYLQTSNDGAYLLMTYFPEATDEDMLTSLSLPDTGENLWDAYEEIFHGKTPASKQAEANSAAISHCKSSDAQDGTQEAGSFHKLTTSEITEAKTLEKISTEVEPGGGKLEMTENVEAVDENTAEIYVEVSQKKPEKNEENWINRVPSTKLPTAHPNIMLLPRGGSQMSSPEEEAKLLQEELTTSTLSLLESVVLFTQISDAVAHLDQQGLVLRDLSSADVYIAGESPWRSAALLVDRSRLYDKICPRHLSYSNAVKRPGAACDQPKMIPLAHDPGFSDESSVVDSLALLGLELFGARSPLADQSKAHMKTWTYPAHVPEVFMRLLDAMLKSNAHKVFSASLLSYSLHLLLWCPQSYLQDRDPLSCKAQVVRWLSTFSAVTFLKSKSTDNEVKVNEEVKQQMKMTFLSTLDGLILSNAVKIVQTVI